ncbi:MAG: M48 family metallopeptidase [Proteobacteria bacterium]|nr:M48 family metallopeptidase [Pseudomonadota bacterium]
MSHSLQNPTWTHFLQHLLLATASLLLTIAVANGSSDLPDLGDESDRIMSPYEERRLGEAYIRQARRQLKFLNDPELLAYVQELGQRLVKNSDLPDLQFQFYIVDDPTINAFAVPGGFITLHSGLITASKSEGELASVIAHEIAHITQRHIPRLLAAQERSALPTMAALIAAIILLNSGNTEGGEAAIALSTAGFMQRGINFTRQHEEEADRVGTRLLADSGMDPRAMVGFFKRLTAWSRLYNTNTPEFLQTHPLSTRRLTESENRAARYPVRKTRPSKAFFHAQARLRALLDTRQPEETVRAFAANLKQKNYKFEGAEHYGYALALSNAGQYKKAQTEFFRLIRKTTDKNQRRQYEKARAESLIEAGNFKAAIAALKKLHKQAPEDAGIALSYTTALMRKREFSRAYQLLRILVRDQQQDPTLQRMLATAAGEAAKPVESHRAMAEYYFLNGISSAALEQLAIARRHAGSSKYSLAAIDARVNDIKHIMDRDKH